MTARQKKSKARRFNHALGVGSMEVLEWLKITGLLLLCATCPPLAVLLVFGCHWRLLVNLLLCFLGFFPGQINAVYALSQKGVLTKNRHRRRNAKRTALEEKAVARMKRCCKHDKGEPPLDVAADLSSPRQLARSATI